MYIQWLAIVVSRGQVLNAKFGSVSNHVLTCPPICPVGSDATYECMSICHFAASSSTARRSRLNPINFLPSFTFYQNLVESVQVATETNQYAFQTKTSGIFAQPPQLQTPNPMRGISNKELKRRSHTKRLGDEHLKSS